MSKLKAVIFVTDDGVHTVEDPETCCEILDNELASEDVDSWFGVETQEDESE